MINLLKISKMKINLIFIFIAIMFYSCSNYAWQLEKINRSIHVGDCNKESMKKIADSVVVILFGGSASEYALKIDENDSLCTFDYRLKPKEGWIIKGGGGYFTFSKSTCKIVKTMGYQ
jgi:hypothetical protein